MVRRIHREATVLNLASPDDLPAIDAWRGVTS
jgi:hypothetical protein